MHKFKKKLFFFWSAIFSFAPFLANAALVPCGKTGERMCTLCDLIVGLHDLVQWGINIMIIAAVVSITIGGILYIVSMGNPGMMGMAKNAIRYAIIGVVVMLCAVLIVTTVMRVLVVKTDLGIGVSGWRSFNCLGQ